MSATAITGRDPKSGCTVSIETEGGLISRIERCDEETDLFVSAGFVDLQVNGCSGFDVNADEITQSTMVGLVEAMLARGVTCFAPTIISAPQDKLCRALSVIAETRRNNAQAAACIPFVHVEGPHISPLEGYRGAHAAQDVRPPSIEEFERWQAACACLVGLVTLSPHYDETPQYISALRLRGVHVALGHTHASPEQIHLAVDAGARLSTHLGNGIAPQIARHRNALWPQLGDDALTATFIADGHHLPPDALKAMVRAKGVERSILISDSVALAGMPAGVYVTPVGGSVELHADGRLCVAGSELLAGSTASLADCIGHLVHATGVTLHDALRMATANPGSFAGGRGQLAVGSRADLVRFRWTEQVAIEDVWLGGERVDPRHHRSSGGGIQV